MDDDNEVFGNWDDDVSIEQLRQEQKQPNRGKSAAKRSHSELNAPTPVSVSELDNQIAALRSINNLHRKALKVSTDPQYQSYLRDLISNNDGSMNKLVSQRRTKEK